jgi:hypothetical protein
MPTAYIIANTNQPLSKTLLEETQARLDYFNWDYQIWPAVVGRNIVDSDWAALGVCALNRGKFFSQPGAQGCFHSHFTLWQHCRHIDQPIVVLEHDALCQAPFPLDLNLEHCVWKLYTATSTKNNDITGQWSRGSWAYTLTPTQALDLIVFSQQYGAQSLDKQIGSRVLNWQHLDSDLFVHNPRPRFSTTTTRVF